MARTAVADAACLPDACPYPADVIETIDGESCRVVTWQFPNRMWVKLALHPHEEAYLLAADPALVLPEEGEDGRFYTAREIELFLRRVRSA